MIRRSRFRDQGKLDAGHHEIIIVDVVVVHVLV